MMEPKEPRTANPGTLLAQWWTLGAVLADRRTTGRHGAVAWVIIDRYMQKYGSGRASLRYIEKAAGISRHTVIKACRELVEWGYFDQHVGIGTRPTEYSPKWLVVHPSTPLASGEPLCTTGGEPICTTRIASGAPVCTENYLREPADEPASRVSRNQNTHAAPTAPLSDGLSATDAGTARDPASDPFDTFFQSYPRKYQKPKARAAWDKLAPDADMAERIVDAAGRWAEHYQANPVDKKWIPAPANWLAGERFDEDLPSVYVDAKEAAIAKAKDKPKKPAVAVNDNAAPAPKRVAKHVEIDHVEIIEKASDDKVMRLYLIEPGTTDGAVDGVPAGILEIVIESPSIKKQEEGQERLQRLATACGVYDVDSVDSLDLHRFTLLSDGTFRPAPQEILDLVYVPSASDAAVR